MTNPVSSTIRRALDALSTALRDAPLEVLMAAALSLCAMVAVHQNGGDDWFPHVAAGVGLAFPLVLALSAAATREAVSPAVRWGGSAAAVAGAALYAAFVRDPERQAEVFRFLCLLAASVCALTLVPRAWRAGDGLDRRRLWRFNAAGLVRVMTSMAYGGALFLALTGAVKAVGELFELDVPNELYGDLASGIFLALVPALVVGGLRDATAEPREPRAVPVVVRVLGRWLYALVVVVYIAILLAYGAKVVITGELPKDLLSPLVLFAGFFGLLGAVYLDPVHDGGESRAVSWVARAFPAALLPLVPLALWAVWVRLAEHGWTEFRYLRFAGLLALGLLAVLGTLRLARRRPPLLAAVPLTLGVVALLAAVGPWSAQSVSRRDQRGRLGHALREAGLMRDGRPPVLVDSVTDARPQVPAKRHDQIADLVRYLAQNHGRASLDGLVAGVADTASAWNIAKHLPMRRGCDDEAMTRDVGFQADDVRPAVAVPAGRLYWLGMVNGNERTLDGLRASVDSLGVLHLARAGWTARVDLTALVPAGGRAGDGCDMERGPAAPPPPDRLRIPLVDTGGAERGVVLLQSLNASFDVRARRLNVYNASVAVVLTEG